jgi:hypothetical protein
MPRPDDNDQDEIVKLRPLADRVREAPWTAVNSAKQAKQAK